MSIPSLVGTAINFRALGGRGPGSRAVPGLYRSGDLSALSRTDGLRIRNELGIAEFVDLRSDEEARRSGPPHSLLEAGVRWVRCPITGYSDAAIQGEAPGAEAYATLYVALLCEASADIVRALETLATSPACAIVFGCYAGKDRTGVLSALLLRILDWPDADIIADYAASGGLLMQQLAHFAPKWQKRGISPQEYAVRLRCPRGAMRLFLRHMDGEHGGPLAFLRRRGLHASVIRALRNRYGTSGPDQVLRCVCSA